MKFIKRNKAGLAHTKFCHETPDGGIDLQVGHILYQISPERITHAPAFALMIWDLNTKNWFTDAVQCDLTNVVTARWLAKANGWLR